MKILSIWVVSIFLIVSNAFGQHQNAAKFKDKGLLIITLGNDTTFIHEYTVNGPQFSSKILNFIGGLRYFEGKGQFDSQGNIQNIQSKAWQWQGDSQWTESSNTSIYATLDSTIIETTRNGIKSTTAYKDKFLFTTSGDAVSFQLFPFMAAKAPVKIGDSIIYKHVNAIGYRDFVIKRISQQEVVVRSSFMGPIRLYVDKNNRLQSIDALGSSLNFSATVHRNKTIDVFKKNAELSYNTKQQLNISTRDTALYLSGDQNIQVVYWQPSARGRKVFGGIVPDNKFWRFGANNATKITLVHPIKSGNTMIPKGNYALFAVPEKGTWQLKFNSRSSVWGTEYDPSFDVVSLPLKLEKSNQYVEKFKINIINIDNGKGKLTAEWEETILSFNFENFIMETSSEVAIKKQVSINKPIDDIWAKWSSNAGLQTFFAQKTNMILEPDGPFEMLFFPDNPPGLRGAEDTKVLAFEKGKMLSFTWNAPPLFPDIRKQRTIVIVRLTTENPAKTTVTLEHLGWGNGPDWVKVANYFDHAWETILGRLKYSAEKGAIDWKNPPKADEIKLK